MIYVWHTGHQINETLSLALHAGIPESILKHTEFADNYINSTNKYTAVGYGILRGTADIFHHNQLRGVDYYEVDRGYINPKHFEGYYRISKNGLQAIYQQKDYPSDRLDKLKFPYQRWHDPKGRIIVCPPTGYIEQYYGMPEGMWTDEIVKMLENTSRPFKVRHKTDTSSLEDDLKGAYCIVTFNSNVAVDATIRGLPVVTGARSVVGGWSANNMDKLIASRIEVPSKEQIDKLLRFISYNQFTLEEIRNGTAWRLLHG